MKKLVNSSSKYNKLDANTRMNMYVRLEFAEPSMRPVSWANLNKNNSYEFHTVFDGMSHREKYVLQNMLEGNKRVLTVRTLNILRNQTAKPYVVRLFYQDKVTEKLVIVADVRLQPGDCMPLPDCQDSDL